jgi:hypothetical protein
MSDECTCDCDVHRVLCPVCVFRNETLDRAAVMFEGIRGTRGVILDAYERGMRRGLEIASDTACPEMCVGNVLNEPAAEEVIAREMMVLRK